ncbi:MAG TPA: pyruvate kinase, partial [Clostridiales bacterium]|nr:pyruvate kinase [Clostridiales bacterium]
MLKIYGTLGPSCDSVDTLEQMLDLGMTGMRLNLSHTGLKQAEELVEKLQLAAQKSGIQPDLLIDMQGPELRIGTLPEPLTLEDGSEVLLGEGGLSVPAMILPHLFPGQKILLDDGKILLQVRSAATDSARAEILRGGVLTSRKSIALSGSRLHPPTMTERDLENIACARAFGVTAVMQPFVRSRADLDAVRAALSEADAS